MTPVGSSPEAATLRPTRPAYRRRTRLKGERGYVLIMSALLMLPLLAFAGFAIDVGCLVRARQPHAARRRRRRPGRRGLDAQRRDEPRRSPWTRPRPTASTTPRPTSPSRSPRSATGACGSASRHRRRRCTCPASSSTRSTSSASPWPSTSRAVPMGSPDNTVGNDPDRWTTPGYTPPYYWLNTSGPNGRKANGDRHTAGVCDAFSGCSGTTNLEYSDDGYFYRLNVDTGRPAGTCTSRSTTRRSSTPGTPATPATCSTRLTRRRRPPTPTGQHPGRPGPRRRRGPLQPGQHAVWCAGDQDINGAHRHDHLRRAGAGRHARSTTSTTRSSAP